MSRHRVKTIGFDDDDYEEYYDEEDEEGIEGDGSELTEEDREQLRLGTIEVQNLLQLLQQDDSAGDGGLATITEKEIKEAVWHYYYDVDKAVAYLKSTHCFRLGFHPLRPLLRGSLVAVVSTGATPAPRG